MKAIYKIVCLVLIIGVTFRQGFCGEKTGSSSGLDVRALEQSSIEFEGRQLVKKSIYDQAIIKFQEALAPRFILKESDKCLPLAGIMGVHRLQGKYNEALEEAEWFLRLNPNKQEYEDNRLELKALGEARAEKDPVPIYKAIKYFREKYKDMLPPKAYVSVYIPIITSKIIYLYDYIGDADGGIAFCDEVLKYWEKKSGYNLHRPGSKEPYFLVRQAFKQDKEEGFKGCLDAKPGEVCMGRAAKAVIQSDYFPW